MPKASLKAIRERRRCLIDLLGAEDLTIAELAERSDVTTRTIETDLGVLEQAGGLHRHRDGRAWRYSWRGCPPHLPGTPVDLLTHREVLALVTARGLLRDPRGHAPELRDEDYPGWLDGALDGLLRRLGLDAEADGITPDAIQVSRFAARPEDPAVLRPVLESVFAGAALRFIYTNLAGRTHPVHARPLRLILIRGEFHCLACDGGTDAGQARIKQYRLARMREVVITAAQPTDAPDRIPRSRLDGRMLEAFCATGSEENGQRRRVRLAVGPKAWPHIEGRTWGSNQRIDQAPARPPRRLAPPGIHHLRSGRMPPLGPLVRRRAARRGPGGTVQVVAATGDGTAGRGSGGVG